MDALPPIGAHVRVRTGDGLEGTVVDACDIGFGGQVCVDLGMGTPTTLLMPVIDFEGVDVIQPV